MPKWQAQLTFKMARHALVDISQIFNTSPLKHDGNERLKTQELETLRAQLETASVVLNTDPGDERTLEELREMYEPYTKVLSRYLMMPLPGWLPKDRASDNWQTSAWEVTAPAADKPFEKCLLKKPARAGLHAKAALNKET